MAKSTDDFGKYGLTTTRNLSTKELFSNNVPLRQVLFHASAKAMADLGRMLTFSNSQTIEDLQNPEIGFWDKCKAWAIVGASAFGATIRGLSQYADHLYDLQNYANGEEAESVDKEPLTGEKDETASIKKVVLTEINLGLLPDPIPYTHNNLHATPKRAVNITEIFNESPDLKDVDIAICEEVWAPEAFELMREGLKDKFEICIENFGASHKLPFLPIFLNSGLAIFIKKEFKLLEANFHRDPALSGMDDFFTNKGIALVKVQISDEHFMSLIWFHAQAGVEPHFMTRFQGTSTECRSTDFKFVRDLMETETKRPPKVAEYLKPGPVIVGGDYNETLNELVQSEHSKEEEEDQTYNAGLHYLFDALHRQPPSNFTLEPEKETEKFPGSALKESYLKEVFFKPEASPVEPCDVQPKLIDDLTPALADVQSGSVTVENKMLFNYLGTNTDHLGVKLTLLLDESKMDLVSDEVSSVIKMK